MPRWLKIVLATLSGIIGLMLLSMLLVPWQIKKQGRNWVAENTSRTLTLEKAFFNPFTLTVELTNLTLSEPNDARDFVAFKRLMLSASIRSLIDQAIILDRVELDDPFVNIELLGKQEFNFSDFTRLGSASPKPSAKEDQKPFHFSFNNIILSNGSIDFTDRTSRLNSQHQVRQFNLNIPFIGNIPYLTDEYVQPRLKLLLNGALVEASGQLKPFHDSFETNLSADFDNIDLAFYAYHSPIPLPIEIKSGYLDCEIDLSYRVSGNEEPKLMLGGVLALTDIDLRELDDRPLFSMPTLILDLDWADLFKQDINLAAIDIYEPQFYLDRDQQGRWNFQRITAQPDTTVKEPAPAAGTTNPLPLLTLESLRLIDGQLHFRDDFVTGGFSEEIKDIDLKLDNLSTHQNALTGTQIKLRDERGGTLGLNGDFGLNPLTAALDFEGQQLLLQPFAPYLEAFLTRNPEGSLTLGGQINYLENGNVLLNRGQLNLQDLLIPFHAKDRFKLSDLDISGIALNLHQRTLQLGAISLKNGEVKFSRLEDGSMSPLKLLKQQAGDTSLGTESPPEEIPWQLFADVFDLQQLKLDYIDRSLPKQPQIKIPGIDVHAQKLSYPKAEKSPFNLRVQVGNKGKIDIDGSIVHTPLNLTTETTISDFPLADLNGFIPDRINLNLKEGRLYSNLTLAVEQRKDQLFGTFSGTTDITRFNLRDPLGDGRLLAWDNLNIKGLKGTLEPLAIHIEDIALSNYLANIQITKDGRINLASITAESAEASPQPAQHIKKSQPADTTQATAQRPDIRIDALTLQGGTVSFVDRSMDNLFSATMYELGGRVTGMASDEQMRADVDLRGQLENHSPLTISGQINPLSQDLFADLTISFKDIDLTPMTPYSGTYIGYVIDKGKLYLDLNYRIEKRKIDAANKVMIDQFTLGDTVESDKAVSLPISLAIALLKDNNDEIHLDVPVHGDLDDPDFSVTGVIFTVIKNLLVKAATSPFSLLSSVLGGGDKDFSSIHFAPGSATVDSQRQTKLATLADMLAKRPSLTLEISGFSDLKKDPEGYRREQLRQMLIATKRQQMLNSGTTVPADQTLTYSDEEYPELLLAVYKAAEFPRPRNMIGILTQLPQEEMEKLLLANIVAGEEEMAELAKNRALAVRDVLVASNEEIKTRIFLKKNDIFQPADKGPNSRVEFGISAK